MREESTRRSVLPHAAALGLLAALAGVLFLDALRAGMIFGSDVLLSFFHQRAYGFARIAAGELPLWNPYVFCGFPFLANMQSALLYPPNWIFLFVETHRAFVLIALGHVLLAGVGMYLYVEQVTRRSLPGLLAGAVYMLSGYFTSHIYAGHVPHYCAYSWAPFIIACLDRSLRRGSWRSACAGGLCFALQILAGYPAMVYYTWLLASAYALGWLWLARRRTTWLRAARSALLPLALLGAVGAALCAVQLLPALQLSLESSRSGGVDYGFAVSYSMPPENLVTYVVPFVFGDMTDPSYWGRWYLWEFLPYVGIAPLAMLAMGGFTGRRLSRFMAGLGLAAAVMALGGYTPIYRMLYEFLPGLEMFRGPARCLIWFAFAAAAGAGLFLDALLSGREDARKGLAGGWKVLAAIGCLVLIADQVLARQDGGDSEEWRTFVASAVAREDHLVMPDTPPAPVLRAAHATARASLHAALLWLALSAAAFWIAARRPSRWTRVAPYSLVVLTVLDLSWASARYLEGTSQREGGLEAPIARVIGAGRSVVPPRLATAREPADLARAGLSGVAHVGGNDPAVLRRYTEYANALAGRSYDEMGVVYAPIRPGPLFDLMGASHVLTAPGVLYPDAEPVLRFTRGTLFERNAHPRAFLVHAWRIVPDRQARLAALTTLSPLEEVILEWPPPGLERPGRAPRAPPESVRIVDYRPHLVEIEVNASSDGILVLTDAYYPAWKARIDGAPTAVFPVNHLFRGVVVPTGRHRIAFEYRDLAFRAGGAISLASLLAVALALTLSRHRQRSPGRRLRVAFRRRGEAGGGLKQYVS